MRDCRSIYVKTLLAHSVYTVNVLADPNRFRVDASPLELGRRSRSCNGNSISPGVFAYYFGRLLKTRARGRHADRGARRNRRSGRLLLANSLVAHGGRLPRIVARLADTIRCSARSRGAEAAPDLVRSMAELGSFRTTAGSDRPLPASPASGIRGLLQSFAGSRTGVSERRAVNRGTSPEPLLNCGGSGHI